MKVMLDAATFSANSAFSARNPYPGWIASAPVISAAAMRRGPADAHVVVREPDVEALAVRFGIHRDRGDAELLACPDDPQGDLPAVRDQHFLKHQGVSSIAPAWSLPPSRFPEESTPDTFNANSLGFEQ